MFIFKLDFAYTVYIIYNIEMLKSWAVAKRKYSQITPEATPPTLTMYSASSSSMGHKIIGCSMEMDSIKLG